MRRIPPPPCWQMAAVLERVKRARVDLGSYERHNDHHRHDDHDCGGSNSDLDHEWRGSAIFDRTCSSPYGALAVSGGRLRHRGFADMQ